MSDRVWKRILIVTALLLALRVPALAQLQTGNLYGTVLAPDGAPLAGVTVTLNGAGAPQTQTTDAQGKFHFLGLPPGAYSVQAEPEGMATLRHDNIVVNVGHNTDVALDMQIRETDTVTVVGDQPPMLDTHRITIGNMVTAAELRSI